MYSKVSQKDKDLESRWGGGGGVVEKGGGILLSWSNLTVKVPAKKPRSCCPGRSREPEPAKKLLDQVTGQARPGELLAILGASGAGKSTLLNTLAFRNLDGLEVEGKRVANKKAVSTTSLTAVSGYVQQEELFISVLSVTEHLTFQSLVRMPKGLRRSERRERVEEVMKELGLASSADTMIGDLSGGEKRRLSVASELLTDPKLLFCDEPTSGLDSHMAASVVDLLLGLAAQGRTVVCTIHQPSSQVQFNLRKEQLLQPFVRFLQLSTDFSSWQRVALRIWVPPGQLQRISLHPKASLALKTLTPQIISSAFWLLNLVMRLKTALE